LAFAGQVFEGTLGARLGNACFDERRGCLETHGMIPFTIRASGPAGSAGAGVGGAGVGGLVDGAGHRLVGVGRRHAVLLVDLALLSFGSFLALFLGASLLFLTFVDGRSSAR